MAQLAINAREGCTAASKMVQDTHDELQATEIVREKLEADLQELGKMLEEVHVS